MRLVGGGPERTDAAAGSAIKGVSVLPTVLKRTSLPETTSTKPYTSSAAGSMTAVGSDRPPMVLTLFTVSRDQRLSRWDIVEDSSLTLVSPNFKGVMGQGRTSADICGGGGRVCSTQVERGAQQNKNASSCGSGVGGSRCDGPVDLQTASSPLGGMGVRQGGQAEKGRRRRRRRWRLAWRAGCVTDVCDVSGLDAVILPSDSHSDITSNISSSRDCRNSHNPPHDGHRQHCGRSTTLEEQGTSTISDQSADGGEGEIGEAGGGSRRAALVSPAAIVAVSGQGLQLVVFGAC